MRIISCNISTCNRLFQFFQAANSGLVRTTANSFLIDAERLGGLEIDDRPEFGGLPDRNIARFRTFKILSTK